LACLKLKSFATPSGGSRPEWLGRIRCRADFALGLLRGFGWLDGCRFLPLTCGALLGFGGEESGFGFGKEIELAFARDASMPCEGETDSKAGELVVACASIRTSRTSSALRLTEYAWSSIGVFSPIYEIICAMMAVHGFVFAKTDTEWRMVMCEDDGAEPQLRNTLEAVNAFTS
jgi:hypothetical protein